MFSFIRNRSKDKLNTTSLYFGGKILQNTMMEGVDNTVWFTSIVLSNIKEKYNFTPDASGK